MQEKLLYYEDPYLKEAEAVIRKIVNEGIYLDQTIFYPRGGGQPSDKGVIIVNDKEIPIKNVRKTEQGILHEIDETQYLEEGQKIKLKINWEHRYALMKLHTSLHVLSAIVYNKFGKLVTGGDIAPKKARLDFDLEKITPEIKQELEEKLNKELQKGHEVSWEFISRKEAEKIPALIRTKINLLPKEIDPIRIVKIGDIDLQADGGLHVKNTKEIGKIIIKKIENKGKGRKRVVITFE